MVDFHRTRLMPRLFFSLCDILFPFQPEFSVRLGRFLPEEGLPSSEWI